MITKEQYDKGTESDDLKNYLQTVKGDDNLFGYIFDTYDADIVIANVVQFFYDYANVSEEGNSDVLYRPGAIIKVIDNIEESSTDYLFAVNSKNPNEVNINKYYPHFRGYDIMSYLAHEIKHQIDLNNGVKYKTNYHREIAADDFAIQHWAYKKAYSAPKEIQKHRNFFLSKIKQ